MGDIRLFGAVALATAGAAFGQPGIQFEQVDLATDFDWGYRCGVKQPLGAFKNGLSVHQISKSNYPAGVNGNPDYVFWVNEDTGEHGIAAMTTTQNDNNVVNPGGQVAFDADGYIWYVNGARVSDMPFDLFRSKQPYDPTAYDTILDDFITLGSSTTPCLDVIGDKLLVSFRQYGSINADLVNAHVVRYDLTQGFDQPDLDLAVGVGSIHPDLGEVGVEQLWTRYDPRYGYQMYTWQHFDIDPHTFGSNPLVYSEDAGETWKAPDGTVLDNLPLTYADNTDILAPYDHIGMGEDAAWYVRDMGVSPGGDFWFTLPVGDTTAWGGWELVFYRFNGAGWTPTTLTAPMRQRSKAHAMGVTDNYLVFVYADLEQQRTLKMRYSSDDGITWSEPVILTDLSDDPGGNLAPCWVSFVQPADGYEDDSARFIYGYYQLEDGLPGISYSNAIRWAKVTLDPPVCDADLNGDGVLDVLDFVKFQELYLAQDPAVDCNDDGAFDILDYVCYQNLFQSCV